MSLQITKVGDGLPCNNDRGINVPVEGTYQGKPFSVEVYLGVQHNSAEITTRSSDALFEVMSEHGIDLIMAAQAAKSYVDATQNK